MTRKGRVWTGATLVLVLAFLENRVAERCQAHAGAHCNASVETRKKIKKKNKKNRGPAERSFLRRAPGLYRPILPVTGG